MENQIGHVVAYNKLLIVQQIIANLCTTRTLSWPRQFLLNFEGKSIDLISAVDKEALIDCENRGPVVNPLVPSGHLNQWI